MSYCLNLSCQKPQNPDQARFCRNCGARLLLGDRYRAKMVISQAKIGRTFLAVDTHNSTQPNCIIKQVSFQNQGTNNIAKAAELFHQEVTTLQALGEHPQIPEILAYFQADNALGMAGAIVQSLITGQSLAQQLEAEGTFNETQIRQILIEILPVFEFIHSQHVIHRDINPNNIIRRDSDRQLVLVDFSAAKVTTKTALAKTGTIIGSAAYTAPEQLMGKAVTSSDLYSLGVICIHLLTHIHPFDLFNSLEGVWVWQDYLIEQVSPELKKIINKIIAYNVNKRYKSAAEIYQELNLKANLPTFTQGSSHLPRSLTPTWKCIRTIKGHFSSINSLVFSPNGQILASGSADRTVKLWQLDRTIPCSSFSGHSSLIDALVFSPDGKILVSGSWDHQIKIWDLSTQECLHTLCQHSGWIHALAITPDGKILISGGSDRQIQLWNFSTGELQATLDQNSSPILAISISPNGQTIASGSSEGTVKLIDFITKELQLTLNQDKTAVNALTFSPSGQILIAGNADGTIKLWKLDTGSLLYTLNDHTAAVNSVAIAAQGTILVSSSADQTIKLWHPGTGKLLYTLAEHTAGVTAVAISPDGATIASGSQDQTIKIWQFE